MAIKHLIAMGIGFSAGSVSFIPTSGFSIPEAAGGNQGAKAWAATIQKARRIARRQRGRRPAG